ncbi:hypothetical protein Q8F57_043930 [Paraburkholderia terrae]|uniref:hypothetical protein n=1 Tax=Paraburkholderia terrae TaxID=311230 RepID=UPI00296B18F8|nr:hypothetical protein [Paraburkholderia terrae]MDW3661907.1 hypothetical protein [Paraburkholderia terrae]
MRDIEEFLIVRGVVGSLESTAWLADEFGTAFTRRVEAAGREPGSILYFDEMLAGHVASSASTWCRAVRRSRIGASVLPRDTFTTVTTGTATN